MSAVQKDTAVQVARATLASVDEARARADGGGELVDWAFRSGQLYHALQQLVDVIDAQDGAA